LRNHGDAAATTFHDLLAAALLATGVFPMISTVIAIIGVAAMIHGLAAGVMVVLNREDDGSPE
jgi:hydrogenase/urease accessory protein HupE